MPNLIPTYTRINCISCKLPIAWTKIPIEDIKLVCNLCRLDEWETLRWLGFVNAVLPQTNTELDNDDTIRGERLDKSDKLHKRIREFTIITHG